MAEFAQEQRRIDEYEWIDSEPSVLADVRSELLIAWADNAAWIIQHASAEQR